MTPRNVCLVETCIARVLELEPSTRVGGQFGLQLSTRVRDDSVRVECLSERLEVSSLPIVFCPLTAESIFLSCSFCLSDTDLWKLQSHPKNGS